jgi:hypothetical protein
MVRGILLGYVVSKKGKKLDLDEVEVIVNLQPPTTVKQIQKVLGHIGWYRNLIEDYSTHAAPLTNFTKKAVKFEWTQQCQDGLNALKEKLTSFPCLLPLDWNKPFHVYSDASKVAIGSALCQPDENGKDHPIAFASKQFTNVECNYTITERECLAMVFSVKKFKHYLLMNLVVFFVDHMALKYIVNKPNLSGRLARWVLLLTEFDYIIKYKPRSLHKQADHLSQLSIELGTVEINDNFPNANLFSIGVVPTWYEHIVEFLRTQQLPEGLSKNERRKVRVNNTHFALILGKLYCKGVNGLLRRCLTYGEVLAILEACHDSACGGHFLGQLTTQKALRAGYFWPTMFVDAESHTKQCDACQRYARNDLHLDFPLNPSLPLVPFEK